MNEMDNIVSLDHQNVLATYDRLPFVLAQGKGSYLFDTEGNRYLDFGAGIAVNALGHCHPRVVSAIEQQARMLSHVSNLYHTAPQAELAHDLCALSFADKVFFSNSGAEANEAAIKFARKHACVKYGAGKTKLIAFSNGFHGRTFGALSVTDREKYQAPFRPLVPDVAIVPFNNCAAAEKAIDSATCAVIVEVVQGEGGIFPAQKEFMRALRKACDTHHALLVIDEIQTGLGRTGRLWAHQHYDVEPDIMTLAKALGGGLPIGATLMTEEVAASIAIGDHGSTFGGNPIAASAARAVLRQMKDETLLAHVREMSAYLIQQLSQLHIAQIDEIRAHGLMVGIELTEEAKPFYRKAHQFGILILTAGTHVIRLLPPLNVTKEEIDQFAAAFKKLMQKESEETDA